jgi:hypothetical protein
MNHRDFPQPVVSQSKVESWYENQAGEDVGSLHELGR